MFGPQISIAKGIIVELSDLTQCSVVPGKRSLGFIGRRQEEGVSSEKLQLLEVEVVVVVGMMEEDSCFCMLLLLSDSKGDSVVLRVDDFGDA